METRRRFFQEPQGSFFLFGPRGTGKTTWLKRNYKKAVFIDLLSPEAYRLYSARPERLVDLVQGNPGKKPSSLMKSKRSRNCWVRSINNSNKIETLPYMGQPELVW